MLQFPKDVVGADSARATCVAIPVAVLLAMVALPAVACSAVGALIPAATALKIEDIAPMATAVALLLHHSARLSRFKSNCSLYVQEILCVQSCTKPLY